MNILSPTKKVYELPIAKTYVRHWGMVEAVRELIQNALDSESPFEYEFDGDTLRIISRFAHLSTSTLLLGQTSKADSPDTIGSFGEGYKIALLVLTRCGYKVTVHNGDRCWTPVFRHSRQFDAEVLCIEDQASSSKREGMAFEVAGLSPSDEAAIRECCLYVQDNIGAFRQTSMGRILLDRPGRLYVGGLFICETRMHYGYDVNPMHLSLERDRQTVSSFDLQFVTKEMWFSTERWADIAEMIDKEVPDLAYAEYGTPEMVKEACYKAFKAKHPGSVVAKTQDELDALVKQGMTNVVVHRGYAPIITQSQAYKTEVHVPATPPADVLRKFLADHRKAMRSSATEAFKAVIDKAEGWRLK